MTYTDSNEPRDYDPHDTEMKALFGQPSENPGQLPHGVRMSVPRFAIQAELVRIEHALGVIRQQLQKFEQFERDPRTD